MQPTIQPNDLMTVSQTNIACANLAVAAQGEQRKKKAYDS